MTHKKFLPLNSHLNAVIINDRKTRFVAAPGSCKTRNTGKGLWDKGILEQIFAGLAWHG